MYSYYDLLDDVNYLAHFGIESGSIGQSVSGKLIPYVHLGSKSGNQIIVTGAIHAREHVAALVVIKQIYAILNAELELDGGIYFVPMANPDGNLLIYGGAAQFPSYKDNLININGSADFSLWKANLRGVDLNCNFNARWATGKENVFSPACESFVGCFACSEPETKALVDFTEKIMPVATLSYHALGQQIYWKFYQSEQKEAKDKKLAEYVNSFLNYEILDSSLGSAGGYKDYCIDTLKIPALTIEVVSGNYCHPLTKESVVKDAELNKFIPARVLSYFSCKQIN